MGIRDDGFALFLVELGHNGAAAAGLLLLTVLSATAGFDLHKTLLGVIETQSQ